MGGRTVAHMYGTTIFMHMRTTMILDDTLLATAMRLTGISEKTAVVHAGLEVLIARSSAERLALLGGSDPAATAAPRTRESVPRKRRVRRG